MALRIDYSKKKFLIIDDFPEFRSSIKRMVESFGGKHIDLSPNGEDASEKISKVKYDIILSDYNLGEGKDGQQILEEAKYKGSLKATAIYILLTAESSIKMVMGAMEYEPDGYLTKPFNKEMVLSRLEKVAEKKEKLMPILKEIDKKNVKKAISLCDEQIKERSKVMIECLKIKGKLLLENKEYKKAQKIYEQILTVREIPWALLGLGKSLYYQDEFYDASEKFQDIIDENSMCVEAYDWLAKAKVELDDLEEAQSILEEAVQLSPKAILRQQELGKIAKQNGDAKVSEKAYRNAVKLGKHSCYRDSDDSMDLAQILVKKASGEGGLAAKRAGNEALTVLKDLAKLYGKDNDIMVKAKLMEAEVYRDLKQEGEAKTAMMKAEKIVKQMGDKVPPEALLALSNGYHDVGKEEKAMDIAKQVVEEHFDNEGLRDQIDDLAAKIGLDADSIINKNQDKIDGLNKRGIALFQSGKLLDAIELFEEAVSEMPNNTSANLNAVQALITYMEQNGKDNAMLNRSRKYLAKFKNLNKKDKRYARYNELQQLHKNLTKS